ncbi:hypothetical protein CRUP_004204, partial [Coryphaenoides rupestris]
MVQLTIVSSHTELHRAPSSPASSSSGWVEMRPMCGALCLAVGGSGRLSPAQLPGGPRPWAANPAKTAHLAMIDALMMAVTMETVSTERVLACVRQYYPCDGDLETPYDTEDAVTTWINKVTDYLKDIITQEHKKKDAQSPDPAGSPRVDVCLKESMTLADRLYNLQLVRDFCREKLSVCCHFSLEDMLYASSTIK